MPQTVMAPKTIPTAKEALGLFDHLIPLLTYYPMDKDIVVNCAQKIIWYLEYMCYLEEKEKENKNAKED